MRTEELEMSLVDYNECFFRDESEEFYEDSSSKDLFKKFELLTPPQSPPHNPYPPDILTSNTVEKCLQMASTILSSELDIEMETEKSLALSNLIQDCMWSGPCLAAAGLIAPDCKATKIITKLSLESSTVDTADSTVPDINSSECVSPAAVFPYPANHRCRKPETKVYNLGSTAESPSPSESEDEEEIDVVTVVAEKMARRHHQSPHRTEEKHSEQTASSNSSFQSHFAAIHNYSNTHSRPASYSAPQSPQSSGSPGSTVHSHKRLRPFSMPTSPQPAKKSRSLLHSTDLKRVVQKLKLKSAHIPVTHSVPHYISSSSRNSSDSEEGDGTNKRAQHNVLERKRRNDLKYSFLKLRDNVPELSKQERTPKVTILKLSSDYIRKVSHQNKLLESELQRTKLRHDHLKRKLESLRRDCL